MPGRFSRITSGVRLWWCYLPLLALSVFAAQTQPLTALQALFPAGAKIIETADLTRIAGKPRTLVLWMPHAERRWGGEEYCGTVVHGDYYFEGSARLSVVDPAAPRIVNTIGIPGRGPGGVDQDDFRLPAHVLDAVYHVPHPDSTGKGVREILHLRDFTGDGIPAEFGLFMYDACGIASGSVLGYDRRSDRVLQYPVEVHDEQGTHIESWVWQVFSTKPVLPGHWKFCWGPGHGSDEILDEDVTFDPARRMFVMRETVQPEPRK